MLGLGLLTFCQALQIDSSDVQALISITAVARSEDNITIARWALERILTVNPNYWPATIQLMEVFKFPTNFMPIIGHVFTWGFYCCKYSCKQSAFSGSLL